jgi:hypothetical protein
MTKLNMDGLEGWYKVTRDQLSQLGGGFFVQKCGGMAKMLVKYFPEMRWQLWKFPAVFDGFWEDEENIYEYLEWLSQEMRIEYPEQWYRVPRKKVPFSSSHSLNLRFI